jgi:hypothetical protein
VLVAPAEGRRQAVPVQVHRRVVDQRQHGQAGLLAGLPERRGGQAGIAGLQVAAELRPDASLAVQAEQHVLGGGVDHEAAGGEVRRRSVPPEPVRVRPQVRQVVRAQRVLLR